MTTSIRPATDNVDDPAAAQFAQGVGPSFVGAAVTAALFAGVALLAPASAQAVPPVPLAPACDNYQFKGGMLQISEGDRTVQVPASERTVSGRAMSAIVGRTEGSFGPAFGGISGRKIDFTVSWEQGPAKGLSEKYTGQVNDDGRASGTVTRLDNFTTDSWRTSDTLSCVAALPPPPAPVPVPPPPVPPTDAVTVSWGDFSLGVGLPVQVKNSSNLSGSCTYDATAPNSLPPYHHDFTIAPSGQATWNIAGLPTGTRWRVVVSCSGDFNGQRVEFGHVDTTKTF